MPPWILLIIVALAVFIAAMFRGPQPRKPPVRERDEDWAKPPRPVPPPLPRRRVLPPPLPRSVPRAEPVVLTVAEPPLPPAPSALDPGKAPRVEGKLKSQAGLQLAALMKDRQTLRAAMMVREVLDPPLCRRGRSRNQ